MGPRYAVMLAVGGVLALPGVGQADPQRRVVVARPANADPVTIEALARVTGELEAAGFEIVAIPVDPNLDQRTTVETIGREVSPVAAFAIFPSPRSTTGQSTAEIWVSDRQKGKATVQRMRVDPQDADRSAAVLAVYAVELLKASLAELWVPEVRRPPPEPPPVAIDVPPPAGRPYTFGGFSVEFAAGLLAHAGGLDPTWTPAGRLSFGAANGFAGRVTVAAGGQNSSVANPTGSARLSHQLVTAEVVKSFRPAARVQPFLALGGGSYRIGVSGVSNDLSAWLGRSTEIWTAAASATAGLTFALGHRMALVASAQTLLFFPRPTIELGADADARVGQAGRPAFLITAGLLASR